MKLFGLGDNSNSHDCMAELIDSGEAVYVGPGMGWSNLEGTLSFTNTSDEGVYFVYTPKRTEEVD